MGARVWTKEKIQEMEKWRHDNEATNQETAKHFGVSPSTYYGAKSYWLTGAKKGGAKTKRVARKTTPSKSFMELEIAEPTPQNMSKVAVFVINANQVGAFLGSLWQ